MTTASPPRGTATAATPKTGRAAAIAKIGETSRAYERLSPAPEPITPATASGSDAAMESEDEARHAASQPDGDDPEGPAFCSANHMSAM